MWILFVVAAIGVICSVYAAHDDFEPFTLLLFGLFLTTLATVGTGALLDTYYRRNSFTAITACETKRLAARRQFLSTNVVCVPGYVATRNDTTTVNLNTKP